MAINRIRYRQLDFIGARILQARELNWLQEIAQGVAVTDNETPVDGQLQSIFRQGSVYNVAVGISGLHVTLTSADGINPMMIFVRDRWEIFPGANDDVAYNNGGTIVPGNGTITLSGIETVIYLNWELVIRTGGLTGDDTLLTDSTTNEAVASAGELILHLSDVDTSGNALSVSQLAKNTSPIPLFTFTNSGTLLTLIPTDNVLTQARATGTSSGLVSVDPAFGGTGSKVVSTNDSRIGAATISVANGLVHDSTVRTPVAFGGTNADGTPIYKLPTDGGTDIGGISAAKVIMISFTQTLEAGWNFLRGAFSTLLGRYNAHETAALGLVNTHPLPTAAQVGAAPLSHVGQPLGLVTSHPPVVNQNSGGFQANQSVDGSANDPAFGVFTLGVNKASLNHDGDVFSNKANGTSSPTIGSLVGGPLGLMSVVARILAGHQNQHGTAAPTDANPHGTAPADIGAASVAYVDAQIAAIVAALSATLTVSPTLTTGLNGGNGKYVILQWNNDGIHPVTLAIGMGTGISVPPAAFFQQGSNFTIPLPTSPAGFLSANAISNVVMQSNGTETHNLHQFYANEVTHVSGLTWNVSSWSVDSAGSPKEDNLRSASIGAWFCVAWIVG